MLSPNADISGWCLTPERAAGNSPLHEAARDFLFFSIALFLMRHKKNAYIRTTK
jgi:hypothetical protein